MVRNTAPTIWITDVEDPLPITAHTVIPIASISRMFAPPQ